MLGCIKKVLYTAHEQPERKTQNQPHGEDGSTSQLLCTKLEMCLSKENYSTKSLLKEKKNAQQEEHNAFKFNSSEVGFLIVIDASS